VKAIERQDQGYPEPLRRTALTVDDEHWISQFDAADALRVSMARVGFLIQGRRLEAAHNAAGQAGVSRASVEREAQLRANARPARRAWLFVTDVVRSVARGI
jgi:hypothetical protein